MIQVYYTPPRRPRKPPAPRGWALVRRTLADIGAGLALAVASALGCVAVFAVFYVFGAGPDWVRWTIVGGIVLVGAALLGRGFRGRNR